MGPGGSNRKEVEGILKNFGIISPQMSLLKKLFIVDGDDRPGDEVKFYKKFTEQELSKIIIDSRLVDASQKYYEETDQDAKKRIKKEAYTRIDEAVLKIKEFVA